MAMSGLSDQENVDPGFSFDPARLAALPPRMRMAPMNSPLTSHLSPIQPRAWPRSSKSSRKLNPLPPLKLKSEEKLVSSVYIYSDRLSEASQNSQKTQDKNEAVHMGESNEGNGTKPNHDASSKAMNLDEGSVHGGIVKDAPSTLEMKRGSIDGDELGKGNRVSANEIEVADSRMGASAKEDTGANTGTVDSTDQLSRSKQFLNEFAVHTKSGCLMIGAGAVKLFSAAAETAASRCRIPTYCLVNCPASILFCCVTEDAPDFPHVNDWIKKDEARKIYCRKLRRHYRKAKRRAYVYIKQRYFGVRPEAEILSKEDRLYEERRIARLEAKNSQRLARASKLVADERQKRDAEKAEEEKVGGLSEKEEVVVYRAPPLRSNRTVMSAMDRAILSHRIKNNANSTGKTKRQRTARSIVQNDRFSMVENALQKQCYTTDGKRFFKSKRQLDAHFSRMARASLPNSLTGAGKQSTDSRRRPLKTINQNILHANEENKKPLEHRDIRKLVAARFPPKQAEKMVAVGNQRSRKRLEDAPLDAFIGESLATLKQKGRKPRGRRHKRKTQGRRITDKEWNGDTDNRDNNEVHGLNNGRHMIYTDLKESRINQLENGLKIYDELFHPGTLRTYLNNADRKCEQRLGNTKVVHTKKKRKIQMTV